MSPDWQWTVAHVGSAGLRERGGEAGVWLSLRCHGDTNHLKVWRASPTGEMTPWLPTGFSSEWFQNGGGGAFPATEAGMKRQWPWVMLASGEELSAATLGVRG